MTENNRRLRLIQLPSGDWIDLLEVRQVRALEESEANVDRVVVVLADGTHIVMGYESGREAATERDRIANLVNEAADREP